jgi:uncharacterized protein YciI
MTVTVSDPGPDGHTSYLVSLTPGRSDWPAGMTADEQAALSSHAAMLEAACADGRCAVAGPCLDAQLGIAVWDGPTLDELLAVVSADAMVVADFFHADVRAMRVSFERSR